MHSFRSTPRSRGQARTIGLAARFGRELRIARVTAGLTQARLAAIAGVTQQHVSNAELGDPAISLAIRCRLAAACGHEMGWRLYPVATIRLRDSGQLGLAQVIVGAASPRWRARMEVPVAPGDSRAADLLLLGAEGLIHLEIERALVDWQAQLRSAQVKRDVLAAREDRPIRLVLAVPDTRTCRARLAPFAEVIRRALPCTSREVWAAIRSGRPLTNDGILFVRAAVRARVGPRAAGRSAHD